MTPKMGRWRYLFLLCVFFFVENPILASSNLVFGIEVLFFLVTLLISSSDKVQYAKNNSKYTMYERIFK